MSVSMFSVIAGLLPTVGSLSNAALVLGALTLCGLSTASGARAAEVAPIPDFTQAGKKDANHDPTLGSTGVRGWIFGSKGQTAAARQILVTAVDTGSPADGVLRVNDVILGMDGKPFAGDARILLVRALLSKHHIREGLSMMENALNGDRIGGDVIPTCLGYLLRYGVHAKEVLPRLKPLEMIRKRWGPQVEAIEKSTESPVLVSLQEFIGKAAASNKTKEIE